MDTTKRTALVTGASGGIGRAFAELLAADGYNVVLVSRGAEALERVGRDLEARFGAGTMVIAQDLGEPAAAERVFAAVTEAGAFVEVLINNAGFATYGDFSEIPLATEREEVNVNVGALTALTKLFLPPMLRHGRGRILNVASTAAFQPGPLMAVYYATKAYVLSFSEALAEEVRGKGVTVTCLCPGSTETGFQSRAKMEESALVRGRKLPDAMSVAKAGYAAMQRGATLEIPGAANAIGAFLPRLVPRALIPRIVKRVQERSH
jgi:hypothetical protein